MPEMSPCSILTGPAMEAQADATRTTSKSSVLKKRVMGGIVNLQRRTMQGFVEACERAGMENGRGHFLAAFTFEISVAEYPTKVGPCWLTKRQRLRSITSSSHRNHRTTSAVTLEWESCAHSVFIFNI